MRIYDSAGSIYVLAPLLAQAQNKPYIYISRPPSGIGLYSSWLYNGGSFNPALLEKSQPGHFKEKGRFWQARGHPRTIGYREVLALVRKATRAWWQDYCDGRWHRLGLLTIDFNLPPGATIKIDGQW